MEREEERKEREGERKREWERERECFSPISLMPHLWLQPTSLNSQGCWISWINVAATYIVTSYKELS